jgi:hypothetical protein
MAALSADASRKTRNRGNVKYHDYVVATGVTIYKGSLCSVNLSTGRLVAASNTTSRKFVGLATQKVTGTASGGETCRVEWNIEALVNSLTALTTAYIGSNVVASTDNDVTRASAYTAAVRVLVGELVSFESGDTWVALRNYSEATV